MLTVSAGSPGELDWLGSLMGLSDSELRAYRFLHATGGAAAGAVASEVGLPRGRIYDLLRGLAERGLVRELPGPRITYVPIPLAEVVSGLQLQAERQLQFLEAARDRLPSPGSEPRGMRTRPGDVSVLHGRRGVEAEVRRILDRAVGQVLIAGSRYLAPRLAAQDKTLLSIAAARARGVRFTFALPDLPEEATARAQIAAEGGPEAVRLFPVESLVGPTFIASDGVALVVVVQPMDASPHRGDDVAVRIEGKPVAEAIRERFEHGHQPLSSPFADQSHLADAWIRLVDNAGKEVVTMGPKEWGRFVESSLPRLERRLAAARSRGVLLRALTEPDAQRPRLLGPLAEFWDIRLQGAVPVWVTIVDRVELYQVFPTRDQGGSLRLRVSRDPAEIEYWLGHFEKWWAEARPIPAV